MKILISLLRSVLNTLLMLSFIASAHGAIVTGDILVADPAASRLWRVDPATGEEQAFAQVSGARDVAVSATGEIYVLGRGVGISTNVFQVDPKTAAVTQVNTTPISSFAGLGIGLGPDGSIYVVGGGSGSISGVHKVDPGTGVVVNVTTTWNSPSIPTDVIFESSSSLLVTSLSTGGGVYRVHVDTGNQVAVNTGSPWVGPTGITNASSGGYIVTDIHRDAVFGWDGTATDPHLISENFPGADPRQSVVDSAGMILVADSNGPSGTRGFVIKVDPSDGSQIILAQGQSLGLDSPAGIAIYQAIPGPDGDFDQDGDVDGADFLVWQRDPTIGALNDWQSNYGTPSLLAGSRIAVPEPTTVLLLLTAIVAAGLQGQLSRQLQTNRKKE